MSIDTDSPVAPVRSLDSPEMDELCRKLEQDSARLRSTGDSIQPQLALFRQAGVFSWFVPREFGGAGWSEAALAQALLKLSASCMTTTFVLTQWVAACKRIVSSDNRSVREKWLPKLACGEAFTTVAISHLTTSRRHLKRPVLQATRVDNGFVLNGFSPWVTGNDLADLFVTGGVLENGLSLLFAIPSSYETIRAQPPFELVALSASRTGEVHFDNTFVSSEWLLAGPAENVIASGSGGGTGGLQTSILALGLADAAIRFGECEAQTRTELLDGVSRIRGEWNAQWDRLLKQLEGNSDCSNEQIRHEANDLALKTTQFSLTIAKGNGYVASHPTGRWCREALFFLVWSCPQPVAHAHLCEFASFD